MTQSLPWGLYKAHTVTLGLISAMKDLLHLQTFLLSLTLLQAAVSATKGKCRPVLLFWDSYNKGPYTGWLKATETYSPISQEARVQNQGAGRVMLLEGSGEDFLASS